MFARSVALFFFCALALTPRSAFAAPTEEIYQLEYRPLRDVGILAASVAAWGLSEAVFKDALAPDTCRWCGPNEPGERLNGLDRAGRKLRWDLDRQSTASRVSDVFAYAAVPVVTLGTNALLANAYADQKAIAVDALIVVQSMALSGVLNQSVKFAVGRERPFVAALPENAKSQTAHLDDNNLSFYSGHTSYAFSMVVSSGVVATLRNYPHRWIVWTAGLPLASFVGYLRIAADKHYLSDVLVGAAVGSAIGVAVPLLLHPREEAPPSALSNLQVGTSGRGFMLSGTF